MADSVDLVNRSDARLLARLLDTGDSPPVSTPAELAAVWQHQLATAMAPDIGDVDARLVPRLTALTITEGVALRTFRDLLGQPRPPVELLRLVKDVAKLSRQQPHGLVPKDIPTALYYACIATALSKCRTRITTMDNAELEHGLLWLQAQEWLDEETRQTAAAALARLGEMA
jgi:hypothetical protein